METEQLAHSTEQLQLLDHLECTAHLAMSIFFFCINM